MKEIYQQFCTDEVKFRALWLWLVSLCNSVLPTSHQLSKQEEWLKGAVQPVNNPNPAPGFDVAAAFNAMPGNIGGSMQVLMEQLGQVNPAQLIGTLGTLVQPILAGIDDPETKQSVAKILMELPDLLPPLSHKPLTLTCFVSADFLLHGIYSDYQSYRATSLVGKKAAASACPRKSVGLILFHPPGR